LTDKEELSPEPVLLPPVMLVDELGPLPTLPLVSDVAWHSAGVAPNSAIASARHDPPARPARLAVTLSDERLTGIVILAFLSKAADLADGCWIVGGTGSLRLSAVLRERRRPFED
jgi:hypothetical protein